MTERFGHRVVIAQLRETGKAESLNSREKLAGEPRRYHLERGGHDFIVFATAEAAQKFHERFGGEVLPVAG